MSDLTPNDIARGLIQYARELEELVDEYRELGEKAAAAKRAYEVAYARAYLAEPEPEETRRTQEDRKQQALRVTADEKYTAEVAEHLVKACSKAIDAKRARIDVGRTLSATTRDEMRLAGVGAV